MWGSGLIGDDYDIPEEIENIESPMVRAITKALAEHPKFKDKPKGLMSIVIQIESSKPKKKEEAPMKKKGHGFPSNGDGWFEHKLGKSAADIVKDLRKARRHHKGLKTDIDEIIGNIQMLKALEVEETLKMHSWAHDRSETLRNLGLSDRNLKAFRRFGEVRSSSLLRACEQWENATGVIKTLESVEDAWDSGQKEEWLTAMEMRKEAKKMWRNTLHQTDALSQIEKEWLQCSVNELGEKGPMTASDILHNMLEKGMHENHLKSLSSRRLASVLNTYGEEVDIMKGGRRGEYILLKQDALVLKESQVWPYAAGFLDADGYITITKRGEPRAGFIATGERGRIHCEQLHKTLGCGVLQLDQKVYKDGQRSQHRLQFYSKDDMRKLLTGITPHLQMKNLQAKAVLEFLDADIERKSQLRRVVQYENWRDTAKGQELLQEWGVDQESINKWSEAIC